RAKKSRSYATAEERDFFARTVSGKSVEEVERLRKLGLDAGAGGALGGIAAPTWFKLATDRIDLMKLVEDRIAVDLKALMTSIEDNAGHAFKIALISCFALLTLTVAIGILIVLSITRPVAALTSAMSALAGNDLEVDIPA